jgi:Protein of unknown function (DUF 659)/hAT family C-terminal dimerisation region
MAQHLEKCVVYQSRIAEENGGPTQQKLNLKQQPLRVRSISKEEQEKLEKKAGYAIYCGARPFSMFMEPYMKDFILNLEPAFEVPSNRTFATTVLDLCYEETRAEVFDVLRRSHFLNVSLDESSNIKRDRIINICILTNFGPFCLRYELVGVGTSSAERIAEWLVKQLEILEKDIGQKLPRINSLTTDTCSTMRSLWELLRTYDRFKYALFVPCDSHGLQLLIKDIISHNMFKDTMKKAQDIVVHFRKSHKQLALLREFQQKIYNRQYALTLAGETRWGTQCNMLSHLKRSKEALRAFAYDGGNDCDNRPILDAIYDYSFWADVDELLDILEPIHKHQIDSESSEKGLDKVYTRWRDIKSHCSRHPRHSEELKRLFKHRCNKQLSTIHHITWLLHPENQSQALASGEQTKMYDFIKEVQPQETYIKTEKGFIDYRMMRQGFESRELWDSEIKSDPITFWSFALQYSPEIAELAIRLFETPANSVPCERAFSTMNLTHTKYRNRLTVDRMHKLCFVHINRRILDRPRNATKKRLDELDEREALELESTLLEAPLDDADTGETGDGETAGGLAETSSKRRRPGEY